MIEKSFKIEIRAVGVIPEQNYRHTFSEQLDRAVQLMIKRLISG